MKQNLETFNLHEVPLRDLLEGEALEIYNQYFANSGPKEVNANKLSNDLGRMLRSAFKYNFDELDRPGIYELIPAMKTAWSETVSEDDLTLYGVCRHGRDLFTKIADALGIESTKVDSKTGLGLRHNLNAIITEKGTRIVNGVSGSTRCYMIETPKDMKEIGIIYTWENIDTDNPLLMSELPSTDLATHILSSYNLENPEEAVALADADETTFINPKEVVVQVYTRDGWNWIVRELEEGKEFAPSNVDDILILKNLNLENYTSNEHTHNWHSEFDLI